METPNIEPKEFYDLQSDVKLLSATQNRLEGTVKSLEALRHIFLVAAGVMAVLGLGGGVIATYAITKLKNQNERLQKAEARLSAIEEKAEQSEKIINSQLEEAKSRFDTYARQHIPEISKEALDTIGRFGIKDMEFTDDNGGHRTTFENGTDKDHQGKKDEIWLFIGDRSIPQEHDNYLILRRPDK